MLRDILDYWENKLIDKKKYGMNLKTFAFLYQKCINYIVCMRER